MNVLVDTSVWSLAFRRHTNNLSPQQRHICKLLEEIISEGRAELLGMVRQELLSGIRKTTQFARLSRALRAFPDVALTVEDYEEAARMSNLCRAKGVAGSGVDYLICATAVRRNWCIFALDHDFEHYSAHLPIKLFSA